MDQELQKSQQGEAMLDLAQPIHSMNSSLWPKHLLDLFIRPTRFFSSQLVLGKIPYVPFIAWCYGVAHSIERIDNAMLRAELGRPRPSWESLAPIITEMLGMAVMSVALFGK